MILSVFTDASIDGSNNIGGYAFYIGCTKGFIKKAGTFKEHMADSGHAELSCVANALYTLKHCKFKPVTQIRLYTDYKQLVTVLNGGINFKSKAMRQVIEEIQMLIFEICIQEGVNIRNWRKFIIVNHVRAHTGKKDKLSIINNWCDKEAVRYRKLATKRKAKT